LDGGLGQWVIPTISKPCEPPATNLDGWTGWWMSTWVGLDGWQPLGSNDILQIGVYQNIDTHGNASTWAWYEWWLANPPARAPAYVDAVPINWNSFPVNPGDTLTATAAYSSGAGIVSLWNETSGKVFRKVLAPPPGADFNGRSAEASECYEDGWNDRACEHPAPGAEFGKDREDEKADRRSGQRANRLEGECAEHELAALGTWDVFRDDHVHCRVIAAEPEPEPEQEDHDLDVVCGEAQRHQERNEDDHLGDKHWLAAETI
jgi:Peptidase A4 family